jgi:hypothetical protein
MEGSPMSEYYEGTSEEGKAEAEDIQRLEDAINNAVRKYFERNQDKQGTDVLFRVVEIQAIGGHNPIHGYRVVVRGET